jgi:hypothetical protein
MSDLEDQLRNLSFREPSPDLRRQVLAGASASAPSARWTWRDWFWPSPIAWGALAALWIVCAVIHSSESPGADSPSTAQVSPHPSSPTPRMLYAGLGLGAWGENFR